MNYHEHITWQSHEYGAGYDNDGEQPHHSPSRQFKRKSQPQSQSKSPRISQIYATSAKEIDQLEDKIDQFIHAEADTKDKISSKFGWCYKIYIWLHWVCARMNLYDMIWYFWFCEYALFMTYID